jgi:hypothetical protein
MARCQQPLVCRYLLLTVGNVCSVAAILTRVGPNIHGISSDVPEGCTVEQAAYVVRHGSRYPDGGAYQEWVALYNKVSGHGPGLRSRARYLILTKK